MKINKSFIGRRFLVQRTNAAGIPSGTYYELTIKDISPSGRAMKVRYSDSARHHWVDCDDYAIVEELPKKGK